MKTESSVRVVTLGKVERDGQKIKQYARFVIVLRQGKVELIDNGARRKEHQPFAKLVAVLGPVRHHGVLVPEALLLEVGYGRTRPYAQLEERPMGPEGKRLACNRWFLKERLRARKISAPELEMIYPLLNQCLTDIVLEQRESWRPENRSPWWIDGPGFVERGIYFTVSQSDRLLYRQFLAEDIRYRREKYINWHATCIDRWVGRYSLRNTDKQLRQRLKISQAAELIASKHYRNPLYRRALLESFRVNSRVRLLLERMDGLFSLGLEEENAEVRLLNEPQLVTLKPFRNIRCRLVKEPRGQPKTHARGSIVVEITLERKFRENHECPF